MCAKLVSCASLPDGCEQTHLPCVRETSQCRNNLPNRPLTLLECRRHVRVAQTIGFVQCVHEWDALQLLQTQRRSSAACAIDLRPLAIQHRLTSWLSMTASPVDRICWKARLASRTRSACFSCDPASESCLPSSRKRIRHARPPSRETYRQSLANCIPMLGTVVMSSLCATGTMAR